MTRGVSAVRETIERLYQANGPAGLSNFVLEDVHRDAPLRAGAFTLVRYCDGVVLVRRKPIPKHPGIERFWWIPGGAVERGEGIADAAVREAQEETGLRIGIDKVVLSGIRASDGFFYFFLTGHVLGGNLGPDGDPDGHTAEARCFAPTDVPMHDVWGEINKIVLAREGIVSCGDLVPMYDAFYRQVLPA